MTITEAPAAVSNQVPKPDRGNLDFTACHADFARALADLKPFVPTRVPLPTLKHVLLELVDDSVRLTVWDYETAASTTLPTRSGATGTRALMAHDVLVKLLAGAAKGESKRDLESAAIRVSARPDGAGSVSAAGFELPVALGDLNDYPAVVHPAAPAWSGAMARTKAQLERTLLAVGRDDTLPMLTAVRLFTDAGDLVSQATDRFRLCETRALGTGELPAPVLMPGKTLEKALKRFTGSTFTVGAKNERGGDYVTVSDGTLTVTTRTVEAEFPRVHMLWPLDGSTVTVDRAKLAALVTKAKNLGEVMPGEGGSLVVFQFAGDTLLITPRRMSPEDEKSAIKAKGRELDATCVGEGRFALSGEFALDALSAFDSEKITLLCTTPHKPVLLADEPTGLDGSLGRRYLQMPVRLPDSP